MSRPQSRTLHLDQCFPCCNRRLTILAIIPPIPVNPCVPSPCGPFSQCQDIGGIPSCSCLPNYAGSAPNCRPECLINTDCTNNKACIREKCMDPCPGSCGTNALCNVINHTPACTCPSDFTGDPFTSCQPKPASKNVLECFDRATLKSNVPTKLHDH